MIYLVFFEEGISCGGVGEWFGSRLAERGFARRYELHAIHENPGVCSVSSGLHKAGLDVEGIVHAVEDGAS